MAQSGNVTKFPGAQNSDFSKQFISYKYYGDLMLALRVTEIKLTGDGGPAGKGLVTPALPYHNHPTYSALFPL